MPLRRSVWHFSAQTHRLGPLEKLTVKLRCLSLQFFSYGVSEKVCRVKIGMASAEIIEQLGQPQRNPRRNGSRLIFHLAISLLNVMRKPFQTRANKKWVLEILLVQKVIQYMGF